MKLNELLSNIWNRRKALWLCYSLIILTGIVMILIRKYFHFRAGYSFLLWNFALALIPLIISSFMLELRRQGGKQRVVAVCGIVWLLFLPNGPYMLTDYKYIWNDHAGHIYPNIACLSWFILPALFASVMSIHDIRNLLEAGYKKGTVIIFLVLVCLLTGFGIFIGSVMRFNTWDLLHRPLQLFSEIMRYFLYPVVDRNPWVITLSYGSLLFLMVMALRVVARELSGSGTER